MKDKEDIELYKKELALEKERVTLTDTGLQHEFFNNLRSDCNCYKYGIIWHVFKGTIVCKKCKGVVTQIKN